jgi:hypothetical protein
MTSSTLQFGMAFFQYFENILVRKKEVGRLDVAMNKARSDIKAKHQTHSGNAVFV